MGAGVIGVNLIDRQIRPLLEALLQDIFLLSILVAASASDQQHAKRFGRGTKADGEA